MKNLNANQINRLKWRCRRGMKELDVLLETFLCNNLSIMNEETLQLFSELLETSDPILYDWFTGRTTPEKKELRDMVIEISSLVS